MQTTPSNGHSDQDAPSTSLSVILAWAFVGIPSIWGISQVVVKSMALFQ